jgi:hypothetical protein
MNRRELILGAAAAAVAAKLPAAAPVQDGVVFIGVHPALPGSEMCLFIEWCNGEIAKITGLTPGMLGYRELFTDGR